MLGIRGKLLLLLLAVAAAPLALAIVYVRISDRSFSEKISQQMSDQLIAKANMEFRQLQALAVAVVQRDKMRVELALDVQARALSQAFSDPAPVLMEWTTTEDMDARGDGTTVDDEHVAIRLVEGARPSLAKTRHEIGHLSHARDVYQFVRDLCPDLIERQYSAMASGNLGVFPAQGGYAEQRAVRAQPWFRAQISSLEPLWHAPMVNMSTGAVYVVRSAPILSEDGRIIGVTAIDIPMHGIIRDLEVPEEWLAGSELMLCALVEDEQSVQSLKVISSRTEETSKADEKGRLALDSLLSSDTDAFDAMLEDMASFEPGIRRMPFDGQSALWAYGPLESHAESRDMNRDGIRRLAIPLLFVVKEETILRDVRRTEAMFDKRLDEQLQFTGALLGTMLAAIGIVTIVLSRKVTRPVRQLHDAALRIGAGDLTARTELPRNDELGELAATFNAMIPKLEDRLHMQQALGLAREVQECLLPEHVPQIAGLDFAGVSRPCDEIGGDYFDYLLSNDDDDDRFISLVIGDVTGHGVGAALLMATARAMIRMAHDGAAPLGTMTTNINNHLSGDAPVGRFMTMLILQLGKPGDPLRWVCAGHDPALLLDPETGAFRQLGGRDIPLGIEPDWTYAEHTLDEPMKIGAVLVLGTDGIWETRDESGAMYGRDRMERLIRDNATRPASDILKALFDDLDSFRGSEPQMDDVTVVIVRRTEN